MGRSQDSDKNPTVYRAVALQRRIIWPKLIVLKLRNSFLDTIMYFLALELELGFNTAQNFQVLGCVETKPGGLPERKIMVNSPLVQWYFKFMSSSSCHFSFFSPQVVAHAFCSFYSCLQQERENGMYLVYLVQFFYWASYLFFLNFRSSSFIIDFSP